VRSGIVLNAGDPRTIAELAHAAEASGWDGVFSYDVIALGGREHHDPWVLLAAMALRTERVRLGAIVFAPTRRRPWKLAREAVTLDHLSDGRLVLPVGLGALEDEGFGPVGEVTALAERAAILDETLTIVDGLWSGEPFSFSGRHYQVSSMTMRPRPLQRPRIPIWAVGVWPHPRSIARALHWDGIVLQTEDVAQVGAVAAHVRSVRSGATGGDFAIVVQGTTMPGVGADETVSRYAAAGATWWIEADWAQPTLAGLRDRIAAGPPRVS
jgi:alkanesulfonate monooxygenase SsuD/methylene tetrahydromethanopterin reductase-like flavin-dependent oxidoreductase (luciferase family)